MIRLLNILALLAVIGSATWAYSVKYETILVSEKLRKREGELQRERDAITILKAEWNLLNRPERLQLLAKPEEGMQQLSAKQVVQPEEVPRVVPGTGNEIDTLLTGSIPTPDSARKSAKARTTTPARATSSASAGSGAPPRSKVRTATTPAAASRPTPAPRTASAAPVRLVPPAPLGASAAPARNASSEGNPLTGFLKKLMR
jgi:hypothetical protein